MYSKNGIGGVVATALLLVVTVLAAVGFQTWFSTYSSNVFTTVEQDGSTESLKTGIERVVGNNLYFNNEDENLTITSVKLDNTECGINGTYSKGIQTIDLSNCTANLSSSTTNIVVFTDKGVYSKDFFHDEESSLSDSTNNSTNNNTSPTSDSKGFVTIWNTSLSGSSNNDQVTLPLISEGNYNFIVEWGDGTNDTITSWNQSNKTHTYSSSGVYRVNITGTIEGWQFGKGSYESWGDAPKLLEIENWGVLKLIDKSLNSFYVGNFYGTSNLNITAVDILNTSNMTSMYGMFQESGITTVSNMEQWDTSSVTNMSYMFRSAKSFNHPLNKWNTSSVTDMSDMFHRAESFNQPLYKWDTSSVENMDSMFRSAFSFNKTLNSWDTSSVQDMSYMFNGVNSFNQPLNNWSTSNVTDMSHMFRSADPFNQSLNTWNVSSVTDMTSMFYDASSFNQPLDEWNTSSLENMVAMFRSADSFNGNVSTWDISSVNQLSSVFYRADSFNQPLNSWDVSNVSSIGVELFFGSPVEYGMFQNADSFNQPLDEWNTSSMTNMNRTFDKAFSYDQDLTSWDVDQVTDCSKFNESTPSSWTQEPNFTNCSP